jgi:hypothetical protein
MEQLIRDHNPSRRDFLIHAQLLALPACSGNRLALLERDEERAEGVICPRSIKRRSAEGMRKNRLSMQEQREQQQEFFITGHMPGSPGGSECAKSVVYERPKCSSDIF